LNTEETPVKHRNLYGRRVGHKLRPGQKELMQNALDAISVPGALRGDLPVGSPLRSMIDLKSLFPEKSEIWLEIGFGGGEHLLAQARQNPDVGIIGCEPFINGVAKLLAAIEEQNLTNIRLVPGDARDLLDVLPDGSISKLFLLYPDPWPKARHHKRRFVNDDNLAAFTRVLKSGAEFRIASDIPDYIDWSLEHIKESPELKLKSDNSADWAVAWPDWHRTRYEAKALREGRTPCYLTFNRI